MSMAVEPIHVNEKERLGERIMNLLADQLTSLESGLRRRQAILRAEVPVVGLNALSWLCAQSFDSRGYWSDREGSFELAGVGGADVVTGDSRLDYQAVMKVLHERIATATGNPRYFGGLRFSSEGGQDSEWDCFKAYRFILPRFEVFRTDGATTLACNMLAGESMKTVEAAFEQLVFSGSRDSVSVFKPIDREEIPDRERWRENVNGALDQVRQAVYEKVVLARKVTYTFPESLNAALLLAALKVKTSKCFHFLFQPHRRVGFVGASPESLYRREGNRVTTEAIAGSRPRGAAKEADDILARELVTSEKELREHAYVVDGIRHRLSGLCGFLVGDPKPGVLKLSRCQHLITRFRGKLNPTAKDADLLVSLHPTPAVGGVPTSRALNDIRRLETFDRGWYAAPVGWISKNIAQFAVGIRAGLCDGPRLHVFSGAGIVGGSVPDQEWEELENKIGDFVGLFGDA